MRYFSGFSLSGEKGLFDEIVGPYEKNPYVVAGFSYGAIKALEYAYSCRERVERLVLLSPAYFMGRPKVFVKTQRLYFKKDPSAYLDKFLENAAYPADKNLLLPFVTAGTSQELEELLTYPWPAEKMQEIAARGTVIETYLGARDKIVDAKEAHSFFKNLGDSYLFKQYGHILREGEKSG